MFLIQSVLEWIVFTVLSLSLPVGSAMRVIQPYKVLSINGTAQVECFIQSQSTSHQSQPQSLPYPNPGPEELRVTLLKGFHGTQKLCLSIVNLIKQRETDVEKGGKVQCSSQVKGGAVEVTVSGLKTTDTDIYRCQIEVLFPPPYLQITGNGTLLHVLDSSNCPVLGTQGQIAHLDNKEEHDEGNEKLAAVSVPVVVLATLVVFVFLIIISTQTLQCNQRRREIVRPIPDMLHKVNAVVFSCENIA